MPKPSLKKPDIEFVPDAWERFERLVKSAAKTQDRTTGLGLRRRRQLSSPDERKPR
jgi:hypothetical protein